MLYDITQGIWKIQETSEYQKEAGSQTQGTSEWLPVVGAIMGKGRERYKLLWIKAAARTLHDRGWSLEPFKIVITVIYTCNFIILFTSVCVSVAQLRLTLCDPTDCSLPGSHEDKGRRQPSTNQRQRPQEKSTLLTPWSQISAIQNVLSPSVCSSLLW